VLFRKKPAAEKRRLLGFVLSNCTWKGGLLTAEYRQPFDLLAKNVIALETRMPAEGTQTGISDNWLPFVDTYRTFFIAPGPAVRAALEAMLAFSGPA